MIWPALVNRGDSHGIMRVGMARMPVSTESRRVLAVGMTASFQTEDFIRSAYSSCRDESRSFRAQFCHQRANRPIAGPFGTVQRFVYCYCSNRGPKSSGRNRCGVRKIPFFHLPLTMWMMDQMRGLQGLGGPRKWLHVRAVGRRSKVPSLAIEYQLVPFCDQRTISPLAVVTNTCRGWPRATMSWC